MFNIFSSTIILASVVAITGCGPSSETENPTNNSSNSDSSSTTPNGTGTSSDNNPQPSEDNTEASEKSRVKLVTQRESCSGYEPVPNVEVLFHDEQGKVVAISKTPENGEFQAEIPDDALHISLIEPASEDLEEKRYIHTYQNIQGGVNLGKISFTKPDWFSKANNCIDTPVPESQNSCQSYKLDVSELLSTYPNHKLQYERTKDLTLSAEYVNGRNFNVSFCESDKSFNFIVSSQDGTQSIGAQFLPVAGQESVKLLPEHFTHQGVKVAPPSGSSFAQNNGINAYQKNNLTGEYHTVLAFKTDEINFIFPTMFESHHYRTQMTDAINLDTYSISMFSYLRSKIENSGHFDSMPTDINFDTAKQFVLGDLNNSFSFSFDFSLLDERIKTSTWSFELFRMYKQPVYWQVNGGIKGHLPKFQFGDALDLEQIEFEKQTKFSVRLNGYAHMPEQLNEYRTYKAETNFNPNEKEFSPYIELGFDFLPIQDSE
ncbi:hypothetical protein [Pseudoalteromonas luteoviolacea]|nr:hypothetical protein [Pseudoalteromonas luteoviolacea]MBE0389903.1 hypothetical protein [Pseudoalteromonas luteoviolacea DSM 6061]